MSIELNWYIEYDNKTFSILHNPKYRTYIFKAAFLFAESEMIKPTENVEISDWVMTLANAVRDISQLMYNFFNVESKLVNSEILKNTFIMVHNVVHV